MFDSKREVLPCKVNTPKELAQSYRESAQLAFSIVRKNCNDDSLLQLVNELLYGTVMSAIDDLDYKIRK